MNDVALTILSETIKSTGIHVGSTNLTEGMRPFINETRNGVYFFDTKQIIKRIDIAAKMVARFVPEEVAVIGKRSYMEKGLNLLHDITHIKSVPNRYFPGSLTNPILPSFLDSRLVIVIDPNYVIKPKDGMNNRLIEEHSVVEASQIGIPIIGVNTTDNVTTDIDFVIPCNHRGRVSFGAFMWLFAQCYYDYIGKGTLPYTADNFTTVD